MEGDYTYQNTVLSDIVHREALKNGNLAVLTLTKEGADDILLVGGAALVGIKNGKDHNRVDKKLRLTRDEVKRRRHVG